MGNFSFFSEEMADQLVEFAGHWRPDLIVYPPLGVVGPLIAAKYDIPVVMQTVGFGHTPWHIKGVTRSLTDAYRRHGVEAPPQDMAWIDVTPPSMSILQNDGEPIIPMQYVPYNGGAVWEEWWETHARSQTATGQPGHRQTDGRWPRSDLLGDGFRQ